MKHWINKNYKTLIIAAFLIPIITVAIVSISHVTQWYGISNPITWSVYLSIGIEIAALSALAAISANMGRKVYFPFSIVTLIQFIGNIFFAYSYININSESFKMWVELVSPLLEFMGVEPTDYVGHKRFLSLFAGGMLPVISLSFLHMLVKFTEEDRMKEIKDDVIVDDTKKNLVDVPKIDAKDLVGEISRIRLSENDLSILERILANPPKPNEALNTAAEKYKKKFREEDFEIDENDLDEEIQNIVGLKEVISPVTHVTENTITKEEQLNLIKEIMKQDQELGLYDLPDNKPLVENPYVSDDFTIGPNGAFEMTDEILEELKKEQDDADSSNIEYIDDEISDWDETLMDGLEDEEFSITEPTNDNKDEIFSTVEQNNENIFDYEEKNDIKVDLSSANIELHNTEENDDLIVRMRDLFLNDEEDEKKNSEDTDQTLISSSVDFETRPEEEPLYWEQDNVNGDEIESDTNLIWYNSESDITIPESPVEATKKVFSRNVNNPRRRNFR